MVQPTHSRQRDDSRRRRWTWSNSPLVRGVFVETQVASVFVVVVDVAPHEPEKISLANYHDVVEKLTPATADPSFGRTVLPGTAKRNADGLYARRFDELNHGGAEYRVPVKDEVFRRGVIGKRVT